MKSLNILMLGGAKRVSIGKMLIDAGRRAGYDVKLYSYELCERVPIASIATVMIGKRWGDADVVSDITDCCRTHAIDILLPFVDGAIAPAAEVGRQLDGVYVPSPKPEICVALFDKVESDGLFEHHGLPRPKRLTLADNHWPKILKPRCGSASRGIKVLKAYEAVENESDYLIQEYVERREEYTVDCFIHCGIKAVVPRIRLEIVGGEVTRTRTIADEEIETLSRKVINGLCLEGAVTLQFLRDKTDGRLMLMEINPRLGGGVVCSIHAGADIPSMIISAWEKREVPEAVWTPGVEIARYMQEVTFMPNQNK